MDLWTEDEMFELAKRVHPPELSSPRALEKICLGVIVKKWKTWTDLNEQLKINPFDKIGKRSFFYKISFDAFPPLKKEYYIIFIFSASIEK